MELEKLKQSTTKLYNDIDKCVSELIHARIAHDSEAEGKALFKMEDLMVGTMQQITCILDFLDGITFQQEKEVVNIPSFWIEDGIKKTPSMCSWASIGDDGKYEHGDIYYDAVGNEITKEEYEALFDKTQD